MNALRTEGSRRAYGVFEGGGAKGLAHIGALRAAEEANIQWIGASGTSAGALVAALVAAGFSAREICDVRHGGTSREPWLETHVLRRICSLEPTQLMEPGSWTDFDEFYKATRHQIRKQSEHEKYVASKGWATRKLMNFLRYRSILFYWIKYKLLFRDALGNRGYFDTTKLIDKIDAVLAHKLNISGRRVVFGDMPIDLRVVASDIQRGMPVIFSRDSHRDVEVARAVAASMAIPGLFRPVSIELSDPSRPSRNLMLLDGGMVANLPAWLFEDDLFDAERDAKVIAFRLGEDLPEIDRPELFLSAVFKTAVFGGQHIPLRRLDRLVDIPLNAASKVGMLDIGISGKAAAKLIHEAQLEAARAIRIQVIELGGTLRSMLNAACRAFKRDFSLPEPCSVSASIALQAGEKHLVVRYESDGAGAEAARLRLFTQRSVAGKAFQAGDIAVWGRPFGLKIGQGKPIPFTPDPPLQPDILTLVCIPIFDSETGVSLPADSRRTVGILSFETNHDIWRKLICDVVQSQFLETSAVLTAMLLGARIWRPFDGRD